ncbi:MAG TPA: cobalamin-binding protein [Spirochaetaceae bacterium]|jgi:iron complex transport system substrate-binding protein|nr:cobalamin-binding protein [Spirochaetaceae bacterium]
MRRTLAIFAAALLAVSAAFGQQLSFTDARGATIAMQGKALRVVSLAPALTEILYASGAGSAVVGVTSYCNFPAAADALPEIGGYSPNTISVEAIVALKPDLIVGERGAHGQLAEQFAKAGLRFAAFELKDFNAIYEALSLIGSIAGDGSTALRQVNSIKARLQAVAAKTGGLAAGAKPLVFWEVWDEPLMTAGPKTFIGQVLSAAGARNAFADVKQDWPVISFEEIVMRKPDYIMASDTHGIALSPEKLAARTGWAGLSAVKERRIILLDGDIVSRPGPRFVEAVELAAKALYPGLF